jgi:hypothetical protein
MQFRRTIPVAAAALLVAAAAAVAFARRGTPEYPTPAPSGASGRVWRQTAEATPLRFPASGEALLNPLQAMAGPDGSLYVMDYGDLTIKQFSPAGAPVQKFGRGRGQGPGEFLNPTDFYVGRAGEVRVLDPAQGRIQVFDARARPTITIPLEEPALRVAVHDDGRYVALVTQERMFQSFTASGQSAGGFGVLVPDQMERAVVLQGELEATRDGGVVYAPLRGGYLARFSSAGELVYYRETVESHPYPDMTTREDGGRVVVPGALEKLSAVSASVQGDTLFVLTAAQVEGKRRAVIDVYDVETGTYHYSFVSPQRGARAIHVSPRYLYVTSDSTVTAWQRESLLRS